jgi:hypothetical protein
MPDIRKVDPLSLASAKTCLWGPLVLSLACSFLAGPALAQMATPVPTVRDAYVVSGKKIVRNARLTDHLTVIVCKAEYDAWKQSLAPVPNLLLYLDGVLMKRVNDTLIDSGPAVENDDPASKAVVACAVTDPAVIAAAKDLQKSQADAQAANDLVTNEKDSSKLPAEKKDADDKTARAQSAKQKAAGIIGSTAVYALNFYLDPQLATADDTKDSWIQLLKQPWRKAPIAVSVGPESGSWPGQVDIYFQRLDLRLLALWAALFVVAVILFIKYARNSDIIRDTGTLSVPAANAGPATSRKAYSLARTQMALWTFIVSAAMVFIFMVTWNENSISSGVLALLGVSFATTLLAAVSDGSEPAPQPSQGFLADLLSDGTGPSFHRYQMVLFTVILAVIFVAKVATNLAMPEFDSMLLGLMGISNGTYLGFKLQGR